MAERWTSDQIKQAAYRLRTGYRTASGTYPQSADMLDAFAARVMADEIKLKRKTGRRRCNAPGPKKYQRCGRMAGHEGFHMEMCGVVGWTDAESLPVSPDAGEGQ